MKKNILLFILFTLFSIHLVQGQNLISVLTSDSLKCWNAKQGNDTSLNYVFEKTNDGIKWSYYYNGHPESLYQPICACYSPNYMPATVHKDTLCLMEISLFLIDNAKYLVSIVGTDSVLLVTIREKNMLSDTIQLTKSKIQHIPAQKITPCRGVIDTLNDSVFITRIFSKITNVFDSNEYLFCDLEFEVDSFLSLSYFMLSDIETNVNGFDSIVFSNMLRQELSVAVKNLPPPKCVYTGKTTYKSSRINLPLFFFGKKIDNVWIKEFLNNTNQKK